MELDVINLEGAKVGSVSVEDSLLEKEVSRSLLHRVVVSYEANARQGTVCTKTRGERSGSGKKPWRQKGTGRARVGSKRSPVWRGGGVVFGPRPRDFSMKTSKKERTVALDAAIRGKLKDGEVLVIDALEPSEAKTKIVASFIKNKSISGRALFIASEPRSTFLRASRNIPDTALIQFSDLNAYAVLAGGTLVIEKSALEAWCGSQKDVA